MEQEGGEIYDDGSSTVQSPVSNLKSRFEQVTKAPNPALKPKPPVKTTSKLGGGGYLQGVVGNNQMPKLAVNGLVGKDGESGTEKGGDSGSQKESAKQVINSVLSKRGSVVKIAGVFQANEEASHVPPKVTPKPTTPIRRTFDTNNNSKFDTKDTEKSIPDLKEAERTVDKKMTGVAEKEICSETSSQGSKTGLSIAERQKLLAQKLAPGNHQVNQNKPGIIAESGKSNLPASSVAQKFGLHRSSSQNTDLAVELRRKLVDSSDPKKLLHRVSVKSVIRNFDAKKFKIAPRETEKEIGKAPEKPPKLDIEIDWDDLIAEFQKNAQAFEVPAGILRPKSRETTRVTTGIEEVEEEEFYDDCGNMVPPERVSIIEPMTEEEELAEERNWNQAGFRGLQQQSEEFPRPPTELLVDGFPQEEYDDVANTIIAEKRDSGGELYEPLPDEENEEPPPLQPKPGETQEPEVPPPPPPEPPRTHKDPKELEKERKKKEKEERERKQKEEKEEKERKKKQEKEQKKKEAELKNMEKTFKISMAELTQSTAQGTIKSTVTKSSKTILAVQEGQLVEIIRMGKPNPNGKFLVRLIENQTVGYVDSSNIEVDTGIIRRLMEGSGQEASSANSTSGQDNESIGETYEDVEGEGQEDLIEEDIYEECT